ncbi:MAG TPA: hypothetical protein VKQ52_13340 [Puia sp.]|nr:hypothetical protein [Puia sp.]
MDKAFVSILTGISPLVFAYVFKRMESRSALAINKGKLEEASNRIVFAEKYLQLQAKVLSDNELSVLNKEVSADLFRLKQDIDTLFIKTEKAHNLKVFSVQKLFLTFRPASWLGWVLAFLFYLSLMFLAFYTMGLFIDDNYNFSFDAFKKQLQDGDTIAGFVICLSLALLIRYLAVSAYKRKTAHALAHP